MSAQHTPGRWALSEDGERVITLTCPEDGGDIICEFPDADSSNVRWEANARLIASAPSLLEALQEARLQLEYLEDRWPTGTTPAVLARVKLAILKATGAGS